MTMPTPPPTPPDDGDHTDPPSWADAIRPYEPSGAADDAAAPAGQSAPPTTATPGTDTAPEPEIGDRWGTFPTSERRAALDARLGAWAAMPDPGGLLGPFDSGGWPGILTGADVYYLAARSLVGPDGDITDGVFQLRTDDLLEELPDLHLEHAVLRGAQLEHANLSGARLEHADLSFAQLERADFLDARLEHASLYAAHLEQALLVAAQLDHIDLSRAHLDHADLYMAHLEHASLYRAHLEYASLREAHLAGADLRGAFLDVGTHLRDAIVTDAEHGSVRVADVRWQGVNLAVVKEWPPDMVLGDEQAAWEIARKPLPETRGRKDRREAAKRRRDEVREAFQEAARANRQLAAAMRDQGMNDEADHFAYRAQVVQRELYRRSGRRARWFGSLLLDLVSGYGYQPIRSVFTYAAVILVFAAAFFVLGASSGAHTLTWNEALVVSVTAFHGRGFFATAFQPGDPQAVVAAVEAIIGLLIEITFIATFTQRFFGK